MASRLAPGLGDVVDKFFECALARDRNERFQSAGAFAAAMVALCASVASPISVPLGSLASPTGARVSLETLVPCDPQTLASTSRPLRDSAAATSSPPSDRWPASTLEVKTPSGMTSTVGPPPKSGRGARGPYRALLAVGALFVVVVACGALLLGRRAANTPTMASAPSLVPSSVPEASPTPVAAPAATTVAEVASAPLVVATSAVRVVATPPQETKAATSTRASKASSSPAMKPSTRATPAAQRDPTFGF